ncbi:hypothetical protein [Tenuibacillus multivorans]|uniref:Uncharacterized protein n=1 Tax=Tenuibacillus multivorans TaxID=237069 RepID=A0A1H0G264_9BACI|nr:hypothetical protein [Tenuibacillus multivorans]GEL78112.1 hypothetical protein TMU01_23470 [Tenuibacillus multivorans]SDO00952.1 hypothetical protein SAMN05216498_0444 [Tenuibacillus multivorans]
MSLDPITSFIVRCQHVSEEESHIKVKLTHVQSNQDLYFDQLDDAFEHIKLLVSKHERKE